MYKLIPLINGGNALSINEGMAQGSFGALYSGGGNGFGDFDLDKGDIFSKTYDLLKQRIHERIAGNVQIQDLLNNKDTWLIEDRVLWEKNLSQIVSEEVHRIQGLDIYRTPAFHDGVNETKSLHDLSLDIANGTSKTEYDCDWMSQFEGLLIQEVENEALAGLHKSDGNYKYPADYYVARVLGGISPTGETEYSNHVVILSSATGAVIEATASGGVNPYYRLSDLSNMGEEAFDRFLAGENLEYERHKHDGTIALGFYGFLGYSDEDVQARYLLIQQGRYPATGVEGSSLVDEKGIDGPVEVAKNIIERIENRFTDSALPPEQELYFLKQQLFYVGKVMGLHAEDVQSSLSFQSLMGENPSVEGFLSEKPYLSQRHEDILELYKKTVERAQQLLGKYEHINPDMYERIKEYLQKKQVGIEQHMDTLSIDPDDYKPKEGMLQQQGNIFVHPMDNEMFGFSGSAL